MTQTLRAIDRQSFGNGECAFAVDLTGLTGRRLGSQTCTT